MVLRLCLDITPTPSRGSYKALSPPCGERWGSESSDFPGPSQVLSLPLGLQRPFPRVRLDQTPGDGPRGRRRLLCGPRPSLPSRRLSWHHSAPPPGFLPVSTVTVLYHGGQEALRAPISPQPRAGAAERLYPEWAWGVRALPLFLLRIPTVSVFL